ncbi:SGNH_hydro domain-containing protein [Haematococcus lacustris]|uniref:SGNH_hydro domain-containing protein n=1 Tax=Haematococcus lacustris TaxID=44745 RepID=A0A699ZE13_HAELA|nr:SGNH_hydro domain-containing protein [Haematococcus lacustris]
MDFQNKQCELRQLPEDRLPASLYIYSPPWPVTEWDAAGNYTWVLKQRARDAGLSYVGSNERLRLAVQRMKEGKPTKVVTIGGSITAGQGSQPKWSQSVGASPPARSTTDHMWVCCRHGPALGASAA